MPCRLHPLLLVLVAATASAEEDNVTTITTTATVPRDMYIDAATGVVLFTQEHSLQRIHGNGTVEVVAGSGTSGISDGIGPTAFFNTPVGITASVWDRNRAYVADYFNHCLRRMDPATRNVTTFAGLCGTSTNGSIDGIGTVARFHRPIRVALFHNTTSGMDEYLYVADTYNHLIRRVEIATAAVTTFAGSAGSSGAADGDRTVTARFYFPADVTVDATGRWLWPIAGSFLSVSTTRETRTGTTGVQGQPSSAHTLSSLSSSSSLFGYGGTAVRESGTPPYGLHKGPVETDPVGTTQER